MSMGKITWIMMEISTILLYIVVIGFGYILGIAWLGWTIFLSLMLLHLGELKTAMTEGHKKGLSNRRIILMNMLFGFTWWVPLRRGIFSK
jgi:hypothetical protein